MRKILSAVVTLLLCIGTGAHAAVKPIPRNPALRLGTLPNGLTYYILHNNHPEHRVNFYIVQRVGSIQEEERQRGLAHFLEHMCFNGTEHFPGNQVVEYLESLGVKFGPNLNAHTSTAISSDWHSTETGIACRATSTSTSDWHAASAATFDTCSS